MKTSMTLKLKSKKLKELSAENAKKVAGGSTDDTIEPQQVYGAYWPRLTSFLC
ncbi:hypothetical protein HG263_12020 [Pseudoalteromonas sp. JBTF-M23]|uniref:Uncharacterized protein n=1 Tax=Pseudoalteromonas caenipelagi TaxID=2726988 RepID=A0A849VHB6_9GAMM|nr:hypothetical protein [Pseudoalteromonas caenipelagi]NOU51254.1 hypothetical protein [Pseudoalteromonas caenipelagi]